MNQFKIHKPDESENKMVLYALMAANAISRIPITEENINEAKDLLSDIIKLRNTAIEELVHRENASRI